MFGVFSNSTLTLTGYAILSHSYEHFMLATPEIVPGSLALWTALLSIGLKEWVYQRTIRIAKHSNSQLLEANAWHHRSDVFSSIVAVIGILGSQYGLTGLDPFAGGVIGFMIGKVGLDYCFSSFKELMDPMDQEVFTRTHQVLGGIPDLVGWRDVKARKSGQWSFVEMVVEVEGGLTIAEVEKIVRRVKREIVEKVEHVHEVIVQVRQGGGLKAELARYENELEEMLGREVIKVRCEESARHGVVVVEIELEGEKVEEGVEQSIRSAVDTVVGEFVEVKFKLSKKDV
eukprot:TRINITY_DN6161_c0_g1_i1.p1 TRINITY_DN6161_c0_g1~~TRINITY_DN6161_c0_g1_i1.p1  ORF type:complete len:287 (-),score=57.99 TRINITY_DN6161_c0_g1_i1:103-963(-)